MRLIEESMMLDGLRYNFFADGRVVAEISKGKLVLRKQQQNLMRIQQK